MAIEHGELFSLLLRLHPIAPGLLSPGSGNQVQAAFLDLVRQGNQALADQLHLPNQRRPYTVSLLQGFNHLTITQLEEARAQQQQLPVLSGQTYWLRITMLDATVFGSFVHTLIDQSHALVVRIGSAQFGISRLFTTPSSETTLSPWIAYSSFEALHTLQLAQRQYRFEFATPTAFSMGQRTWGKMLKVFPEPALVFESLARQWETFAPPHLHMSEQHLTPRDLSMWCEEHLVVARYQLHTGYLATNRFGQVGFQGMVTYEVKGNLNGPEAQWLTPLARFALFGGVGYKTTMGMGQARCLSPQESADGSVQTSSLEEEV